MNRQRIKTWAYKLSQPFSIDWLREISRQHFIFPFYHLVAETTPAYIRHLYRAPTREAFKADLEFLLKHYRPATVKDVKHFLQDGKNTNTPKFFLSFDDGLKECYEVVYPILKEKGIQAAFFINPDFIDNRAFFYRFKTSLVIEKILQGLDKDLLLEVKAVLDISSPEDNELVQKINKLTNREENKLDEIARLLGLNTGEIHKKEKPYMAMEQLKQMESDGFLIGSHSMNHPLFENITLQEQIVQVEKSMEFIHKNFNPEISAFAFPYTDDGVSSSLFDYLDKNEKVDVTFGTAGMKRDHYPKHIQRIPMESQEFAGSEAIIRSEYFYYLGKALLMKNQGTRK